jgi:hypothetical protein
MGEMVVRVDDDESAMDSIIKLSQLAESAGGVGVEY